VKEIGEVERQVGGGVAQPLQPGVEVAAVFGFLGFCFCFCFGFRFQFWF
jgi:hypothetical protein